MAAVGAFSRNLEFIQAFPGVIRRTGAEVKSTMELREFVANLHGNRRNGFRIVMHGTASGSFVDWLTRLEAGERGSMECRVGAGVWVGARSAWDSC